MGRTQRPLDPTAGPIAAFAAELRKLRASVGEPKFSAMARNSSRSRTALTEAAGGDHLPTWGTVAAYVRACGANPAEWEPKWLATRQAIQNWPLEVAVPANFEPVQTAPTQTDHVPWSLTSRSTPRPPQQAGRSLRLVIVQNKIAIGSGRLVEDSTPVYLSTKPQPYGKRLGCAVPDTDMWSAAVVPAAGHVAGAYMVNYNISDTCVQDNPHRVESTRWYWVVLPDGRAGYLSEIYVEPRFRGGLGLPRLPVRQLQSVQP